MEVKVTTVFALFVALTLVGFSTASAVTNGDDISHGWGVVRDGSYNVPDSFRNGSPMITTGYGAMDTLAMNGNDMTHGWGVVTNGSYNVPSGRAYVRTGYGTMETQTLNGDDISHGWGVVPDGSYNMPAR